MSKPLYGYWDIRGIGYPIKMALAYLGVDYEDKRYPTDEAGYGEWTKDKFDLGLDFPNLPYWKENGRNLTESRAVLKAIAREKGNGILMPKDPNFLNQAEMVESVLWDVWWLLIRRCLLDSEELKTQLEKNGPAKFEQLNTFLGNKKWVTGDEICFVDFMLYEVLYHFTAYDSEYIKQYAGLVGLKTRFESIPAIAELMNSPQYIKGPCFHPMFIKHKV